jgi:hypothetical protein
MRPWDLSRYALTSCVAAALLAGCGGSQPPIGAPGAMPQSSAVATSIGHGKSWMLPGSSGGDLIYVASYPTAVLSYTTGKLVGTIDAGYEGVCSDSSGNVFFVGSNSSVVEYRHGGTTPIATLYLPGKYPSATGCASDPTTGNLAVTYATEYQGGSAENVAVFPNAQGAPTVYQSGIYSTFCTYDDKGDLFADGFLGNGAGIAELPSGDSSFVDFSLNQGIGGNPWSVLWDGKYLSVEGATNRSVTFSRVAITGSTATIVGTVHIGGKTHGARASWLVGGTLIIPYNRSVAKIGFWRYPKGGKPKQVFTLKNFGEQLSYAQGLAISIAPPH